MNSRAAGQAGGNSGREHTFVLADGRRVGCTEYGTQGPVILYCHGFPGSRQEAQLLAPALKAQAVRLLAVDRPGYGRSDPSPGRTIPSWVGDARQLLAGLGVARCAVLGVSGGAPYALALLHGAPEVTHGAVVSGLGPPQALFAERRHLFFAARAALGLARRYPALTPFLARLSVDWLRLRLRTVPLRYAGGRDVTVLRDARVESVLCAAQREGLRQGAASAAEELLLYLAPWGFALEEISKPVGLWHGGADRIVPIGVARRVACSLPQVAAHYCPADGHYSLPILRGAAIIGGLRDGTVS
ncbi:MAG: alpha/beta hydrolase [Gammaproteobacteria bacterium]|nr:alpha/beta hydrolase [Gammaproteobacteria bacterium]